MHSGNCVIDSNFIVKIVAVGVEDMLEQWRVSGVINGGHSEIEQQEQHQSQQQEKRAPTDIEDAEKNKKTLLEKNSINSKINDFFGKFF